MADEDNLSSEYDVTNFVNATKMPLSTYVMNCKELE